jgi:hypothetical protein
MPARLIEFRRRWSHTASGAPSRSPRETHDESGAILILAMVFLVTVSLIVLGLLTWVGGSLRATASFTNERSVEGAATSAVNLAIQNSRQTFATQMQNAFGGPSTSPQPSACWFDGSGNAQQPPPINGVQFDVWWSMVWQPFTATTRTITYSACPRVTGESSVTCAENPLLQAVEVYDDYPPGVGTPRVNPVQCNYYGYCGQSTTQLSWQWRPTVPAVTSISTSPNTTPLVGGTPLTITGTGFVPGSSVNFVEESGNAASSSNVVITYTASQVTTSGCSASTNTCTTLSLTTPPVTSGPSYFVTVTTPGGTSLFTPSAVLTYATSPPTVSGISGTEETGTPPVPGGSITGGSTVTVTGSGFYNASNFAAQVWFWSGTTSFQASNVNVLSNTSLTAETPAVSSPGNWYVQVDTLGGDSSQTQYVFNYGVQVPIIISLNPPSAATGSITITGGNFLPGSTVAFFLDQNGTATGSGISASASVSSPTSMKVTIPSGLTPNAQYFPVITLPAPYGTNPNTYPPSQPYNEPADIFTYTPVTPTVTVTFPTNGTTYGGFRNSTWTGTITGTASSNSAGTIASSAVAIENTTTQKWWNGTSFGSGTQTFAPASGTTNWTYAFTSGNLTVGDSYSVIGEATDTLSNVGTSSITTFTYQ